MCSSPLTPSPLLLFLQQCAPALESLYLLFLSPWVHNLRLYFLQSLAHMASSCWVLLWPSCLKHLHCLFLLYFSAVNYLPMCIDLFIYIYYLFLPAQIAAHWNQRLWSLPFCCPQCQAQCSAYSRPSNMTLNWPWTTETTYLAVCWHFILMKMTVCIDGISNSFV